MHFFLKTIELVDRIFKYLLIFFMIEITLVIFISVISRYFLNSPIYWAEEVTRYSFVWATFLGAACAYRRKELVSMSVVINALSEKYRHWVQLVLELIILVFLVLSVVFGIKMTMVVSPQLAVSTRVSMAWLYTVVPISCGFMFLICIVNIYRLAKTLRLFHSNGRVGQ
jgi:TRAP-type C4-dicarboxylate transport system permease small subunit